MSNDGCEQTVGPLCPWCLEPGDICDCDEAKRHWSVYVDANGALVFRVPRGGDTGITIQWLDVEYQ